MRETKVYRSFSSWLRGVPDAIIKQIGLLREERVNVLPGTPMPVQPGNGLDSGPRRRIGGTPRREQMQYARTTSTTPRMRKHQAFAGPCRIT